MRALTAVMVLVALGAASKALATAQEPDKIMYEGKEYELLINPMEPYFQKYPDKRPKGGMISTALWRRYVGTFEFKDKNLLLEDIQIATRTDDGEGWKSVKNELVARDKALAIDWFNGILVLPDGEVARYVHMGYASSYSRYILLEVRGGKLTGERRLDQDQYEQFREKQFQAYRKTEEYKKSIAELAKNGNSREFIDAFLRDYVVSYTSRFLDEHETPAKAGDAKQATGPTTREAK